MPVLLLLLVALAGSGCGWRYECVRASKPTEGEAGVATVGSSIVEIGCYETMARPVGLTRVLFKRKARPVRAAHSVWQELLYSGNEASILHLTYREYTQDGIARSPFFQQATYDLSKSKEIVFKDWTIEVEETDNQKLKYKIVRAPASAVYRAPRP
jgi:hypothetical protein